MAKLKNFNVQAKNIGLKVNKQGNKKYGKKKNQNIMLFTYDSRNLSWLYSASSYIVTEFNHCLTTSK
jgi:hypothetical protein